MVMLVLPIEAVTVQATGLVGEPVSIAVPGAVWMSKKLRKRFRKTLVTPMSNFGNQP